MPLAPFEVWIGSSLADTDASAGAVRCGSGPITTEPTNGEALYISCGGLTAAGLVTSVVSGSTGGNGGGGSGDSGGSGEGDVSQYVTLKQVPSGEARGMCVWLCFSHTEHCSLLSTQ